MLKISLEDNVVFLIATTYEKLQGYPYSQLLSQANVEYVADLQNLEVEFTIKNNTSDRGVTFSNVKKIVLAQ